MFTFTNMVPKKKINKHCFKTGEATPHSGYRELNDVLEECIQALDSMGDAFRHVGRIPAPPPPPKTRTEKFLELPIPVKVSWVSLFTLFILPTLGMLFLFVAGMFGTRTVNPEGVEYYEIYMNALSVIRIFGICISCLTLSIYTLWKSK